MKIKVMKKLIMLITIIAAPLFAQTEMMLIHTASGGIKNYNLSEIEKITFLDENGNNLIRLHLSQGTTEDADLGEIKKITFAPYGTITKPLYIAYKNGIRDSIDLNLIREIVYDPTTGVTENNNDELKVDLIYPLPSGNKVNAELIITREVNIDIKIYDINGNQVKNLCNEKLAPGNHLLTWDRTDNQMNIVPAGLYFLKIKSGNINIEKKIIIE
jgi:hypothetical protein